MEKCTINNEVTMPIPEGFHIMSAEELAKSFGKPDPCRWGMWNQERHIMIILEWKTYSALTMKMTNLQKITARNESITKRCAKNNAYQLQGFFPGRIGGLNAEGYNYYYKVQGIDQQNISLLTVKENTVYRLSSIGRVENADADRAFLDEICEMVKFG